MSKQFFYFNISFNINFSTKRLDIRSTSAIALSMLVLGMAAPAMAQTASNTSTANTSTPATTDIASARIRELRKSSDRWIEVRLSTQRLVAWEGNKPVYAIIISSGTENFPTRPGAFKIQSKHEVARMRGDDYDIPDVPYTMYYDNSYAIHGAYWNRSFGTPVSHGCVNVAVNHAEWLFNWANVGTPVVVHD
jgi:lipoprotein-anchoring transpeptidase ErfK/SrfK